MCLNSPYQDHLEVMSSGDSTVVSSSAPETNKINSSNHTESNEKDIRTSSPRLPDPNTITDDATNDTLASDDLLSFDMRDVEQSNEDNNPPPFSSISTSESSENVSLGKEMTSLEVITLFEEGELKRDDARSAFEITSVRLANTEELERSARKNPVSNDSLRVTLPEEKGESGDSTINDDEKEIDPKRSKTKTAPKFVIDNVNSDNERDSSKESNGGGGLLLAASPSNTNLIADDPAKIGGPSLVPPPCSGVGTVAVNGTGTQFRRVNQYDRGRWTVRDSMVTEEQDESVPPQKQFNAATTTNQQELENNTPPKAQQHQAGSLNDLQSFAELALISGGDLTSHDRADSISAPMDRSSTATETLSRNTSMSSIVAAEKSIDGDEILRDIDEGSGGTGVNFSLGAGGQEQDIIDTTTTQQLSSQPPSVLTASVGAIPPPSSTVLLREEAHASITTIEDRDYKRVEHAMSFLQNELKEVLTSSSYPKLLLEENRVLKDRHQTMDATNNKLKNELRQTKEELQFIKDDNVRLKKELAELRRSLSVLAQTTSMYSANSPMLEESDVSISASHSVGGEHQYQHTVTPAVSSSSNNTSLDYPPHEST